MASKYIIEISAIIAGVISIFKAVQFFHRLWAKIENLPEMVEKINKNDEIQQSALRCILRQDIINLTDDIIKNNYITKEQIYCLRRLYDNYKDLKGNSTVEERVKLVLSLKQKEGDFVPKELK